MSQPIKKVAGYTLIELLVTLSIITLIGLTGLPQLASNNDKTRLESAANTIRQIILSARTRSLAPGSGEYATKQVFEVRFGSFENVDTASATANGTRQTDLVETLAGAATCDGTEQLSQQQLIRQYTLPKGTYISKFYPTNAFPGDKEALIRFSVGRLGFVCGAENSTLYDSTNFRSWLGRDTTTSAPGYGKYLIIELSSVKSAQKKYVAVDRQTSEVFTSNSDPQSYLTPTNDTFAPQWSHDPTALDFAQIGLKCFTYSSDVTLSFKRAKDRITTTAVDANLSVYYDISWSLVNDPNKFEPLSLRYYYDVSQDVVVYRFSTDQITIPNQPAAVYFRLTALDSTGNIQLSSEASAVNKPAVFSQTPECGLFPAEDDDTPEDGVDQDDTLKCENIVFNTKPGLFKRFIQVVRASQSPLAIATETPSEACAGMDFEAPPPG